MDQRIIDLYDEYTHRPLDRRVFLDRLAALVGGTAAAYALLPLLENNYALAQQVAPDDRRLVAERVTFAGPGGPVGAHLARPAGEGRWPAVIVVHENRGLNAHIEDVARRAALAGFLALAPDLLSPLGGTPADEDRAREMIGGLNAEDAVSNLRAAVAWLERHSQSTGKVGAVGFCWGGGMVNALAVAEPELDAGVAFYGRAPDPAKVGQIRARMMMHYAGNDARINEGIPAYEAALRDAGKTFEIHRYEGTQHAFHNDTAGARYDAAAAKLAWDRTVAFLRAGLA
ncbi:dienelactone hydrolase family protein [Arenibaculum pallidiluteum]|uniref:dienelactone hydrolase family protein n=1 Tax=Arenibaculum pallidiluteum TaxID=2812559 RepID=UPI001A974487|nr:dienelactone hydrolase family protein [Arenibaculum pallidiluteum]